ncbi:MAG: hypothetical protein JWM78_2640 [Verrucomicrobiaceae bacterium]|nr:hypothetical protein [Verrucomicrobiaceae bacterium]
MIQRAAIFVSPFFKRPLFLASLLFSIHAYAADEAAGFLTGQELLNDCGLAIQAFNGGTVVSATDAAQIAECKSYIRGVIEAEWTDNKKLASCRPQEDISLTAMIRIVTKFLIDRPQQLEKPAPTVIKIALAKLSSCDEG